MAKRLSQVGEKKIDIGLFLLLQSGLASYCNNEAVCKYVGAYVGKRNHTSQ